VKPDPARLLEVAGAHLMSKTAAALEPGYQQSEVMILGVMMSAVREELERAASRRVEENREMRRIFAGAAPVVADGDLRSRLEAAAASEDTSFRVSDLEAANCELRALLIDLHAHVEEVDSPEARRVEEAIWAELVASTERRKLSIGPF
jgi:hypothetical protein